MIAHPIASPYTKRGTHIWRISCLVLVLYLRLFVLIGIPCTFATSPTPKPCSIKHIPLPKVKVPEISDRRSSLLWKLRGGNDNSDGKRNGEAPQKSFDEGPGDRHMETKKQKSIPASIQANNRSFKMYCTCMGIVSLWMLAGTLFYSYTNEWPLPQSFFYAVDAGMSIGFCTDVAEVKLVSKAFTIVYIILGASVVGGALALFIQDIVEGIVEQERKNNRLVLTKEYELMLEQEAFEQLDISRTGTLTKDKFFKLLKSKSKGTNNNTTGSSDPQLSDDDIDVLWTKFDRIEDGAIRFEEFMGSSRGIEELIDSLDHKDTTTHRKSIDKEEEGESAPKLLKWISSLASPVVSFARPLLKKENRIYFVFLAWVFLGISWGILNQGWDPITATHFAISALSTGGLTAPPVNSDGILPAGPSIFCGCFCLFGIPLMAITFGHFARALVSDHVAEMEKWALTRPVTATYYEIAKQYLVRTRGENSIESNRKRWRQQDWRGLRLSDFIVLQIFRQGRISVDTIDILRKEFDLLDADSNGLLTLEELVHN